MGLLSSPVNWMAFEGTMSMVWRVTLILITFSLQLKDILMADCEANWTGPGCNFMCRCGGGTGCADDGTCLPTKRCDRGFFGFACQYVDMVEADPKNVLNDYDDTTCVNDRNKKELTLKAKAHRFMFLEAVFTSNSQLKSVADIHVQIRHDNTTVECADKRVFFVNSKLLQMHCSLTTNAVNHFVFTGDFVTNLCGVHSSAGRNVALKAKANASTSFSTSKAMAVTDGKESWSESTFNNTYCFHSGNQDRKPTINVSFETDFHVHRIRLANRIGFLAGRMRYFFLYTFDSHNKPVLNYESDQGIKNVYYVDHPFDRPIRMIQMYIVKSAVPNENSIFINLCELEAFGECAKTHFGLNCLQYCSTNCKSRQCNIYGTCYECNNRHYDYNCTRECPAKCKLSTNCDRLTGQCNEGCEDNYYGSVCNLRCSENCERPKCHQFNGTCATKCIDGYYSHNCSLTCPLNCLQLNCTRLDGTCIGGCNAKYYGAKCDQLCSENCVKPMCHQFNGTCISPCMDGFHSHNCSLTCPSNCLNLACERSNGTCIGGCRAGFHGPNCNKSCPEHCYKGCNSTSGVCLGGCSGNFYGNFCQNACPEHCYKGCNSTSGVCLGGCSGYYYGNYCQNGCSDNCFKGCNHTTGMCDKGCRYGFFGYFCEKECHENCFTCNRITGKCESTCVFGHWGPYCNYTCPEQCAEKTPCDNVTGSCNFGCKLGFRGSRCNETCPVGCWPETGCEQITGRCTIGCLYGLYGAQCNVACPSSCQDNSTCDQDTGHCTLACDDGYYGSDCSKICHESCFVCEKVAGECIGDCRPGYYSATCRKKCSERCTNKTCDRIDGKCKEGCVIGYHGQVCELNCSLNCGGGKGCDRVTGKCLDEVCKPGRYGSTCELNCPKNCADTLCDNVDGHCGNGCVKGHYGLKCQSTCENSCLDKNCQQDTGFCLMCKPKLTGEICEFKCQNCAGNGTCHQRSRACDSGCIEGFKGENCSEEGGGSGISVFIFCSVVAMVLAVFSSLLLRKRMINRQSTAHPEMGAH